MTARWKHAVAPLFALATLVACAAPQGDETRRRGLFRGRDRRDRHGRGACRGREDRIDGYQFDHLTPTGRHLFKAAVYGDNHVPAIDDLDPFGGAYGGAPKYFMTPAVIPDLAADLHAH